MKLAQISDMHLKSDHEQLEGIDTWSHFELVLRDAVNVGSEYLVFSSDVCNDEEDADATRLFREAVEQYDLPFAVIPGNHDTSETIRKVFPEQDYPTAVS